MVATKSNVIKSLSIAALALPGMIPKANAMQSGKQASIDFQYGHYQESDNRISVDVFQGLIALPVSNSLEIRSNWVVDTFSGATPVLTIPESVAQTVTGASGIIGIDNSISVDANEQSVQVMTGASTRETRYGVDLGFNYSVDDFKLHASGSRSEEPDYMSHGYRIGADWEFNQKFNTLSLGFGQNFDQVQPSTRNINKEKTDHHFQLGFNQVVSKKSLFRLSTNYTLSQGYLSNPYKKVFIQGLPATNQLESGGFNNTFYENRPDNRDQWSVSLGYTQYINRFDSALHLDYRYFIDSWDITSHTFEAIYHQPIAKGWLLTPRLRYYSQSSAYFYQEYYAAPRSDNDYSSDFRLAGFGSLGGGVKLTKEWQHVSKVVEIISLEAGFDYTTHAAGLKLGNQTHSNLTDFEYMLFTGRVNIKF